MTYKSLSTISRVQVRKVRAVLRAGIRGCLGGPRLGRRRSFLPSSDIIALELFLKLLPLDTPPKVLAVDGEPTL